MWGLRLYGHWSYMRTGFMRGRHIRTGFIRGLGLYSRLAVYKKGLAIFENGYIRGLALYENLSYEDWSYKMTGILWGLGLYKDWRYIRTGVLWELELYGQAICEDWGHLRTGVIRGLDLYEDWVCLRTGWYWIIPPWWTAAMSPRSYSRLQKQIVT